MNLCRLSSFTTSNMFTPSHTLLKHWSSYAEVMPGALIKEAQADVTKPNITGYKWFTAPICHTYVASVNTYQHWGYCTGRCKTSFIIYMCFNVATNLQSWVVASLTCNTKCEALGSHLIKIQVKSRNSPILDVCWCCCCASLQKKVTCLIFNINHKLLKG